MTLSNPRRALIFWVALYGVAFCIGSALDLWSTMAAMQRPGAVEANPTAATDGVFHLGKALIGTAAAAAIMLPAFAAALLFARNVPEPVLRAPMRSFFAIYALNPFDRRAWRAAPLYTTSLLLAFPVARIAAAVNNLLIAGGYRGPLGIPVKALSEHVSATAAFLIVAGGLVCGVAVLLSPLAARLLEQFRPAGLHAA